MKERVKEGVNGEDGEIRWVMRRIIIIMRGTFGDMIGLWVCVDSIIVGMDGVGINWRLK